MSTLRAVHQAARAPRAPLFPSTTLFRSVAADGPRTEADGADRESGAAEHSTPHRNRSPSATRVVTGSERSEEHTSELQSLTNLVCRLLLEQRNSSHRSRSAQPTEPAEDL